MGKGLSEIESQRPSNGGLDRENRGGKFLIMGKCHVKQEEIQR